MVGLGDLPGGDFYSNALDVSADGSTIVGDKFSHLGREAVRWTSAGGIESLWDVLLAHGIDPAAGGWTHLVRATGVSANGNAIVGFGARNGNVESFIAVVPEPGCLSLFGLAVPALLCREVRQQRNCEMKKLPVRLTASHTTHKRKNNRMTKYLTVIAAAALAAPLVLFAPTPVACADIFEWEYIDPANPSAGQAARCQTLAPGGAVRMPGQRLTCRTAI